MAFEYAGIDLTADPYYCSLMSASLAGSLRRSVQPKGVTPGAAIGAGTAGEANIQIEFAIQRSVRADVLAALDALKYLLDYELAQPLKLDPWPDRFWNVVPVDVLNSELIGMGDTGETIPMGWLAPSPFAMRNTLTTIPTSIIAASPHTLNITHPTYLAVGTWRAEPIYIIHATTVTGLVKLENVTAGTSLTLTSTLTNGDYLKIDVAARQVSRSADGITYTPVIGYTAETFPYLLPRVTNSIRVTNVAGTLDVTFNERHKV